MNANLSPIEVVAWLRKQAKTYNDAADSIEATFAPTPNHGALAPATRTVIREVNGHEAIYPQLSLESIQSRLAKKAARPRDLALEYGVNESKIIELVESPESNIRKLERGWLKFGNNDSV